jgi:hypothetical protein
MKMNKNSSVAKFPISLTLENIVCSNECRDFQFLAILKTLKSRRERNTENELAPAFSVGNTYIIAISTRDMIPIKPSKHIL